MAHYTSDDLSFVPQMTVRKFSGHYLRQLHSVRGSQLESGDRTHFEYHASPSPNVTVHGPDIAIQNFPATPPNGALEAFRGSQSRRRRSHQCRESKVSQNGSSRLVDQDIGLARSSRSVQVSIRQSTHRTYTLDISVAHTGAQIVQICETFGGVLDLVKIFSQLLASLPGLSKVPPSADAPPRLAQLQPCKHGCSQNDTKGRSSRHILSRR